MSTRFLYDRHLIGEKVDWMNKTMFTLRLLCICLLSRNLALQSNDNGQRPPQKKHFGIKQKKTINCADSLFALLTRFPISESDDFERRNHYLFVCFLVRNNLHRQFWLANNQVVDLWSWKTKIFHNLFTAILLLPFRTFCWTPFHFDALALVNLVNLVNRSLSIREVKCIRVVRYTTGTCVFSITIFGRSFRVCRITQCG